MAMLTKALSKAMKGARLPRASLLARRASHPTTVVLSSALTLACVEAGLLSQALGVRDDARQALLPLRMTASAVLSAVAKARMVRHVSRSWPS